MEDKALRRLDDAIRRLLAQHGQASTRAGQLAAALAKSRDEIEKLKAQNFRYKTERAEARKKIDAVIRRIDRLGEQAGGQEHETGD